MNDSQPLSHTCTLTVEPQHTAAIVGSGELEVLATPALATLIERAAMLAAGPVVPPGSTTVGSAISLSHNRPSPLGTVVEATATLTERNGRRLTFAATVTQNGEVIATADHTRVVVDRERFMSKLNH